MGVYQWDQVAGGRRGGHDRAMDDQPTHRRQMDFEVFEEGGDFRAVGRLRDDRPWAASTESIEHVHEMELEVTVRRADMTITAARAEMRRFPHAECPDIEGAFDGLVGLSVARGYTRAVQDRFGRSLGCTHLELLARCMGPVMIQAVASAAARLQDPVRLQEVIAEAGPMWFADTCHVWATDPPGPGMEKLALGWRPTAGQYPAPSAVEIRANPPTR